MLYFIKFIYNTFLLPPGIFIILLSVFCIWLYRRDRKASLALSLTVVLLYVVSIPLTGNVLIRSLENKYQPSHSINGDVIIMLGGGATADTPDGNGIGGLSGSSANRLLTTVRLYNNTKLPVIVSGGKVFEDSGNEAEIAERIMIDLGIPKNKVLPENRSRNTNENVDNIAKILESHGFKKPVLVTSAFHMERSVRTFAKHNISVKPYPTDYLASKQSSINLNSFIPSYASLFITGTALREYLGMVAQSLSLS